MDLFQIFLNKNDIQEQYSNKKHVFCNKKSKTPKHLGFFVTENSSINTIHRLPHRRMCSMESRDMEQIQV